MGYTLWFERKRPKEEKPLIYTFNQEITPLEIPEFLVRHCFL